MMEKGHRKKLNEIMGQIECSKMFECTTSGFKNLCEAKDYILDDYAGISSKRFGDVNIMLY